MSAPNDRKLAPRWEPGPGIVQLVDGRRIRARGLDNPAPPEPPEFGLYLLAHPPPVTNWEQRWLPWKNYWLPRRHRETIAALCDAYERSATERVEVACEAGTGRTGTALACLAVLAGTPIQDAVPYIRYRYNDRAVRAPWQRWFIRWFARQAARRRAARA